jgi:hypothetical protein
LLPGFPNRRFNLTHPVLQHIQFLLLLDTLFFQFQPGML